TVDDLAEFRVSFEGETARWAARRADKEDVARLTELAERFTERAKEDGLPWRVLVEIDLAFHEALAEASKNAVRVGIMLGIHRALHEASSSLDPYASPSVRRRIGTELRHMAAALVTTYSLSHTRARLAATSKGARIASMPGITVDMFERTLPIDYTHLETLGRTLAAQLTAAERCHVTAPAGTDVELVLRGREGRSDDGDLRAPGAFGNLPAGEAYIAPFEQEGEGTIVFDASVASSGLLAEPL